MQITRNLNTRKIEKYNTIFRFYLVFIIKLWLGLEWNGPDNHYVIESCKCCPDEWSHPENPLHNIVITNVRTVYLWLQYNFIIKNIFSNIGFLLTVSFHVFIFFLSFVQVKLLFTHINCIESEGVLAWY